MEEPPTVRHGSLRIPICHRTHRIATRAELMQLSHSVDNCVVEAKMASAHPNHTLFFLLPEESLRIQVEMSNSNKTAGVSECLLNTLLYYVPAGVIMSRSICKNGIARTIATHVDIKVHS